LWAGSIFLTSCFYIPSKRFVAGVTNAAGGRVTPERFTDFWNVYWWLFVKGWHATEYAVLFALTFRALRRGVEELRAIGWSFLLCAAFAASDEFHQTFVKDRGGNLRDVCIDVGRALVAGGVAFLACRAHEKGRRFGPKLAE